jgi:hypothetical protein
MSEPACSRRTYPQPFLPVFFAILLGLNLITLLTMLLVRERLGGGLGGPAWEGHTSTSTWTLFGFTQSRHIVPGPEIWAHGASSTALADHNGVRRCEPLQVHPTAGQLALPTISYPNNHRTVHLSP